MTDKKLTIDLTSEKYNFIIEGKSIDKPRVFVPLLANFSCEYKLKDNYHLDGFDFAVSYILANRKDMTHFVSLGSKTIRIQIPDYLITDINVVAKYGNVFMKNLILDKTNLSSINGKINIKNCSVSSLNIETFEGKVCLFDVSGDLCRVKTKNGNICVSDNFPDRTNLISNDGDIFMSLMSEDYVNVNSVLKTKNNTIVQTVNNEKVLSRKLIMETVNGNIYNKQI